METIMKQIFTCADILLPTFRLDAEKMEKWSVIACDQYTSEAKYWNEVENYVGSSPSTLRLMLPEIYLESDPESRIAKIETAMKEYKSKVFERFDHSMIYLKRTLKNGKIRRGIMGMLDLEAYDYNKGAEAYIRATEGTVLSRIPPRVKIRRGAALELPHIMMLIDDRENKIIEPLEASCAAFEKAYSFELMQNGGRVDGFFIDKQTQSKLLALIDTLADPDSYEDKYGVRENIPMIFAAGDGNHSLASAKAYYEELKKTLSPEAAACHPARYALVELVNIHDNALDFEPIYRVVFDTDSSALLDALKEYATLDRGGQNSFEIECITESGTESIRIENDNNELAVGALQDFLDAYLASHDGKIDYIHGEGSAKALAKQKNAVGFIFDGMKKDELFKSVIKNGALPRKTFSMGEADDKRFYLEARSITE